MNESAKDFFRRSRRMFDELAAEEQQERTQQATRAAHAQRRERIATAALSGITANSSLHVGNDSVTFARERDARELARAATALADALIAELDKDPDQ